MPGYIPPVVAAAGRGLEVVALGLRRVFSAGLSAELCHHLGPAPPKVRF